MGHPRSQGVDTAKRECKRYSPPERMSTHLVPIEQATQGFRGGNVNPPRVLYATRRAVRVRRFPSLWRIASTTRPPSSRRRVSYRNSRSVM